MIGTLMCLAWLQRLTMMLPLILMTTTTLTTTTTTTNTTMAAGVIPMTATQMLPGAVVVAQVRSVQRQAQMKVLAMKAAQPHTGQRLPSF